MAKTIRERVRGAFSEDDHESLSQYIDWLRAGISDLRDSVRRAAVLLLLLIATFEFIEYSGAATVLGGFRIDRGSIVLQFIPALVAYFYLQVVVDTIRGNSLVSAFEAGFDSWHPKAAENDLSSFVTAQSPLFLRQSSRKENEENRYFGDKVEDRMTGVFVFVILVGTYAFEAQAYYALFNARHSVGLIILWAISLSITLFCLSMAFIYGAAESGY